MNNLEASQKARVYSAVEKQMPSFFQSGLTYNSYKVKKKIARFGLLRSGCS